LALGCFDEESGKSIARVINAIAAIRLAFNPPSGLSSEEAWKFTVSAARTAVGAAIPMFVAAEKAMERYTTIKSSDLTS